MLEYENFGVIKMTFEERGRPIIWIWFLGRILCHNGCADRATFLQ